MRSTSRRECARARAARIAALLALLGASACSDAIDVFAHAGGDRDGDAATEPAAPARDAGATHEPDAGAEPAPDAHGDAGKPPRVDTGTPSAGCERCTADQICALDACVDDADVHTIALSLAHACEVTRGQLFCWGDNRSAQLGVGDTQPRDRRTRVGTGNDWLSASVGEEHSCAIRAPGALYCWGGNASGQLGLGDTNPRDRPAQVGGGERWQSVACGGESCCALQAGGALYCWGDNREGKIGQGDPGRSPDVPEPLRVAPDTRFRTVAVGQGHVCAIASDGALYCWGRNSDLQLGIGSADPVQLRAPARVGDASDWRAIALSQHHSCGVRDDGSLWCWGTNAFFELGAPPEVMSAAAPRRVGGDSDWQGVGAGWFHTCASKRDARLFCWGRAIEGQLGQGRRDEPLEAPGAIAAPEHWRAFSLGNFYTCGVDESDALYCWGAGVDDGSGSPPEGPNGPGGPGGSPTPRAYLPTPVP
jgi:alpha-tubulin suppressor-like RCC1 family protein